jgi:hypothetical protein
MSFFLAEQIVTVTVLHSVDAIGSMLFQSFCLSPANIFDSTSMVGTSRAPDDRTARFIAALHPVKGAEFPRHGAAADGDEIGIAFHASTRRSRPISLIGAWISLSRKSLCSDKR